MDQEVEAMAPEGVVTGMAAAARELGEEATVQEKVWRALLMAQQSVRQTVLLMAQLTGRQRAWQTAQ